MQTVADRPEAPTAIRTDLGAIFVSLELSRSTWLITSLSPGGGEKMSKQVVRGGDVAGLLERFARLREKTRARTGKVFPFVVIQEAGLDGFWIDRALQNEGVESHVVDPASIATSRRHRRAKTDRIDGEALVRALLAYKRGEPRVCAMVKAPTPEEEDRRRLCRERKALIVERVRHVNRVKGLLFSQGISGYEPLRRDRRERLDTLQTGDGSRLPDHLKAQVRRELDRLELLLEQIKAVEAERDVLLAAQRVAAPAAMLLDIKGIGPGFAAILWSEGLFRHFDNRRQVASYAGLATTPWQSGSIDREQGVSKALGKRGRCFRRGPMRGSAVRGPYPPGSGVVQFGVNLHKQNKTNAAKTPSTFLGATLAVTRVSIERGLLRLFRKSLEWGQCELLSTTLLGNSQYGPCLPMGSSLLGHAPPPSRLC